jgi:hypothetical protein
MASVKVLINKLKEEWSTPRAAFHRGREIPFRLACSFSKKKVDSKIDERFPSKFREFWSLIESARLFEDQDYGQWGLEILSPENAESLTRLFQRERSKDYLEGDFIIGRFLGDSDLLMIRCNRNELDFGSVKVVLPLDPREDWDQLGDDFEVFFNQYVAEQGAKYWEHL